MRQHHFSGLFNTLRILKRGGFVPIYSDIHTMLSSAEAEKLYWLAREAPEHGTIVEIGCYEGGSTRILGLGAKKSGAKVYSVDPFVSQSERQLLFHDGSDYFKEFDEKPSFATVLQNMRRHGLEEVVKLIQGFSQDVARTWNNGKVNLLWIDGNHNEAAADFYAWRSHLVEGALVAFHDATYPWRGKLRVTEDVRKIIEQEEVYALTGCDSMRILKMKN
jgi:predicted O-methyltransferase YrrM